MSMCKPPAAGMAMQSVLEIAVAHYHWWRAVPAGTFVLLAGGLALGADGPPRQKYAQGQVAQPPASYVSGRGPRRTPSRRHTPWRPLARTERGTPAAGDTSPCVITPTARQVQRHGWQVPQTHPG